MTHDQLNADPDTHQAAGISEINDVKEMIEVNATVPSVAITEALADGAAAVSFIEWLISGAE